MGEALTADIYTNLGFSQLKILPICSEGGDFSSPSLFLQDGKFLSLGDNGNDQ
jgi:hypothetical protein